MNVADRETCYRALQTRDPRFDGNLFVGVTSTGIYCRPICPAHTPQLKNCQFFLSAAAAQESGFRPCLRCRPETAPDLACWRGTSNSVSRALALIAEGTLGADRSGVEALADRLGIGGRHLRRLFKQHLGASPVAVMQTRRVLFAKQLIQETALPMAEVSEASGFSSIRRFNETFHELFRRPPSALRRSRTADTAENSIATAGVSLQLPYRPPYDWPAMLAYLRARAIEGVETVDENSYARTVSLDGHIGSIVIRCRVNSKSLAVTIRFPSVRSLPAIVARVRRAFDVGADVQTIAAHLSHDRSLAPLIAKRPGLRAPGAWDSFELAVRAVLGQQITVTSARRLASQVVLHYGEFIPEDLRSHPELTHIFPPPERLATADLSCLGMPGARRETLKALAIAASSNHLFRPSSTVEEAVERLRQVPGIGEWTAQYIALRALREPDAFPASDVGLLRGAAVMDGIKLTPKALLTRSETWRPWRAYAAQHLWAAAESEHLKENHV